MLYLTYISALFSEEKLTAPRADLPIYYMNYPYQNEWTQQNDNGKSRRPIGMQSTTISSLQLHYEIV